MSESVRRYACFGSLVAVSLFLILIPRPQQASACTYTPTWLISTSTNPNGWRFFAGWNQEEAMYQYVDKLTLPTKTTRTISISNEGRCASTTPGHFTGAEAPKSLAANVPSAETPRWIVGVRNASSWFHFHTFRNWWQRFRMLNFVAINCDPFPQYYGLPFKFVTVQIRGVD